MQSEEKHSQKAGKPQTLFEKIWQSHIVQPETDETPAVLYIDLHLLHEVTTPQAFTELKQRGLPIARIDRCLATIDHSTPTLPVDENGEHQYGSNEARNQVETLYRNCAEHGITLHGWDSPNRGIVHVMGPEMGATQPGMTIVCGDSHTSTHGAFGALAFGIGTTEVGHVMATQCLLQSKPRTLAINIEGELGPGVGAKDVILHVIGKIGIGGGTGSVIEYRGSTIRAMDMESRMTICNMSIECGARAGLIAPDDTTFEFVKGRQLAPKGDEWEVALAHWKTLQSDEGAQFDRTVYIDATKIRPTVTYGTHPGLVTPADAPLPHQHADDAFEDALEYMGFKPGEELGDQAVDVVFLGSCTNSRLGDLRSAAAILNKRQIAPGLRMLVVPGSEQVKREAEAEGLHEIFLAAGAQWREPGCSMCLSMNGDGAQPGELVVSTSNRNFKGRQGRGSRTVLASPETAAASAIAGRITNALEYLQTEEGKS